MVSRRARMAMGLKREAFFTTASGCEATEWPKSIL